MEISTILVIIGIILVIATIIYGMLSNSVGNSVHNFLYISAALGLVLGFFLSVFPFQTYSSPKERTSALSEEETVSISIEEIQSLRSLMEKQILITQNLLEQIQYLNTHLSENVLSDDNSNNAPLSSDPSIVVP